MTSPLAGATLTAQRAQNRWKTYHLAVSHPNTVFTARINQTFDSLDGVNQLAYDGGTGTYGDVLPGMTCWVGSSAGAFDVGMVRVRKALTSTIAYIGRVADVAFADNLYLTFVDDFQLWGKDPRVTGDSTLMDEDVQFDRFSSFAPIVKVGPPVLILELTGATVSHTPAITIYSPTGATAATYATTAPGASATSGLTTATPTITYNAAGEYYETYTVTDSALIPASTTVTRKVIVNPADAVISPPEISGDIDSGGWSCRIEGYSGVSLTDLHDRALCVLWKKDYKDTARDTAYGPYSGAENIRLIGWLDGQSLSINPDFGTASFTIQGPAFWLDKIQGAPMNLTAANPITDPTSWNEMAAMTTDYALYRLVYWQTTLASITDVTFTGDDTLIHYATVNSGSIRQQIDGLANEKLLARLCFDRFGCGRVAIPQSLQDSVGKSALTVLWDCASADWVDQVSIPQRETVGSASMIELGGNSFDGTTETQIYSRAPGNSPSHYGSPQAPYSTLAVDSQAVMNRLSGDVYAAQNATYPTVDLELYWANDFIDFQSYIVRLSIATGDTPRGIVWSNKRLVPQAISYPYDPDTGAEGTVITFAEETTGVDGVFYFPPQPAAVDTWKVPGFTFPPFDFSPGFGTWYPQVVPTPPPAGDCGVDAPENAFGITWDKSDVSGLDDVLSAFAYFPCKLRPASATNGNSYILLDLAYLGDAITNVHCYAIDAAKNRLLTGSISNFNVGANFWSNSRIDFTPVGETDVAGFEFVVDSGGTIGEARALDVIASGVVAAGGGSIELASAYNLVPGKWYAVDGTGGPYQQGGHDDWQFALNSNPTGRVFLDGIYQFSTVIYAGGINQQINDYYGRIIFTASVNVFTDWFGTVGSGTIGYILRNALIKSTRRVYFGGTGIHNVCAAG